jgi:hypothetical protein
VQLHGSAGRTWLAFIYVLLESFGKRADERRSLMPCYSQGFPLTESSDEFRVACGDGGLPSCSCLSREGRGVTRHRGLMHNVVTRLNQLP